MFSYKYRFVCPTGGSIGVRYNYTWYHFTNGQELSLNNATWLDTEDISFMSVISTSDQARLTISGAGRYQGMSTIGFSKQDQYIEIVPTTSNVETNSNFPYKLGYYGIF